MRAYCSHCGHNSYAERDPDKGYICCLDCGKVLDDNIYESGLFEKGADGGSRLAGTIMDSIEGHTSFSVEARVDRGRNEIDEMASNLEIGGKDIVVNSAVAFYRIAVDKDFIKGRSVANVAAACLYLACRQKKRPYLLIDFSDYLQISVYTLGAVFLQLCKNLSIWDHPIIQKLVDPSLFIHRFTERLLTQTRGAQSENAWHDRVTVSETALHIIASMKRDWMQTGRKPSGLCGAAIYISALSHGLHCSKSDIVAVVHVCEATLTKRLIEFENTESGCLTIEEFVARAKELDESYQTQLPREGELLCKHKDGTKPHFAHGLCKKCYDKFMKLSGGLQGGAEPPAFQRAERQREEFGKEGNIEESSNYNHANGCTHVTRKVESYPKISSQLTGDDASTISREPENCGSQTVDAPSHDEPHNACEAAADESETFSDIDDVEVDGYLHNEEEKQYKKIIWEEMNKEYLEEQAAKEAAAAEEKKARDALLANLPEDLAAEAIAALLKPKKERKKRRAGDAKDSPAQTPLEATCGVLKRKSFSSKVNYKALEALYRSDEDYAKKQRTESDDDAGGADEQQNAEENKKVFDSGTVDDGNEAETFDDAQGAEEFNYEDYDPDGDAYGYDDDSME